MTWRPPGASSPGRCAGTILAEVTTDRAPAYPRVLDELLPSALHTVEQYANNPIEADHGRLKAKLRPMRGLKQHRSARTLAAGHAFVQNLRRGHYEVATEVPARRQDPRLARIYYQQMTERGATHLKACCVVAGHLAERAWAVMNRGTPYVICDNNGTPVTPEQARQIIAEKWTVPQEVRKRRRSRKIAGRAPQAATTGPDRRGDPPRPRSSRPRGKAVNPAT